MSSPSIRYGLALALILADGCSSAAGSSAIPAALVRGTASQAMPAAGTRGHATTTTIKIAIPHKHKRHGRYVSPSTVAATLAVVPAKGCTDCSKALQLNFHLVAPSAGCSWSPSATTCQFALDLAPGAYTGSFSTYDGWNAASQQPAGNALSQDQAFPMSIVAGKANVPSITLDGIAVDLQVFSMTPSTLVTYGPSGWTYGAIVPGATGKLSVVAYDADDNAILGPGAPTYQVTASAPFSAKASAGVISITAPAKATPGQSQIAITPSTCGAFNCTYTVWTEVMPTLAVAANGTSVLILHVNTPSSSPSAAATIGGFNGITKMLFDSDGNLFVADSGGSVREYAPPYTGNPIATITAGISVVGWMAVAPNGSLAIDDAVNAMVSVYTRETSGTIDTIPVMQYTSPTESFAGVGFDNADNLWIGEYSGASGQAIEFTATSGYKNAGSGIQGLTIPSSFAFDPNDDIFIADGEKVYEFDAPFYTGSSVASVSFDDVSAIARDDYPAFAGNTTEAACSAVDGIEVLEYAGSALGGIPGAKALQPPTCSIALDQDGDVFYVAAPGVGIMTSAGGYAGNAGAGSITLPGSATGATAIAVYPGPNAAI